MRIAFFTDTYLPKFDGVTSVVDTWAEKLSKKHKVKVFAPAYARQRLSEKRKNFTVERFESLPLPASDRIHLVMPDFSGQIAEEIDQFKPDIVHVHSLGVLSLVAARAAERRKIPLVGTYHSLLSEMIVNTPPFEALAHVIEPGNGEEGWLRKLGWGLTKLIYAKCDLIVSPAAAIKKDLRSHDFNNWVEVVSNGTDVDKFKYKKKEKFNNLLIHVGRISPEKHVNIVVKSFAEAVKTRPELRLVIAGDGVAMKEIKKLIRDLNLERKINLLGFVPREQLIKYYQQADFFVTASTMEVQPMVILEALATGLPVIAINKAGLIGGNVKNGYNGYLVSEQNCDSLTNKILQSYKDQNKWKQLSENARKSAENNSIDKSVERIEKLYKKLIT